jgi:hypothetical protein
VYGCTKKSTSKHRGKITCEQTGNEVTMSAAAYSKEYKFGADYEVVCELINGEVAHHFSQIYELGEDSALGTLHLKSMDALQQIRDTLNPNDPETVRIAMLALDAI